MRTPSGESSQPPSQVPRWQAGSRCFSAARSAVPELPSPNPTVPVQGELLEVFGVSIRGITSAREVTLLGAVVIKFTNFKESLCCLIQGCRISNTHKCPSGWAGSGVGSPSKTFFSSQSPKECQCEGKCLGTSGVGASHRF